ncbi:class I SAM-dependent methyltransferase [Mariniplasma anaerobium]|uniref:Methyltransferase n=1 Tax=Mariniplasma anaerobium TaxID=2735436 RepID=A0A7U9TKU3_9MOLU|nr:class I SAM-dependent methyltransferase [Mariniplasma anaerobium]BCR36481.1 methyltransferase [Mariniplasma anaerobium]
MEICKLCNSKHMITYKHPKFDMIFHECLDCEVIYKDKSQILSEEDEKKVYDLHENTIDNPGYVNFLTNFIDSAVIPFIKKGIALDFGSGPGPVLQHILNTKYQFKCDIYDYYYAKHKKVFDKKYDLITSTEVFEHLSNPISILNQFHEILKSQGIVSIMTLFYPKDQETFFDWFYIRDPSHITFFTPKTFEVIASLTGFKVIDTNNYRYITLKKLPE